MRFGAFIIAALSLASEALACDPCALYMASRLQGHSADTFTLSVSEQYTEFDSPYDPSENSVRDGEFVRKFSTTQFALAYDFTGKFGMQVTLPVVARRFEEVEQYRRSVKSDAGIGDASLVGTYSFLNVRKGDWTTLAGVTGGVKFPTGDTGVLRDISNEESLPALSLTRHHSISTAGGGRALTFGTGSYDYIFGFNVFSRYQRHLVLGSVQYTVRTEGDFDYEFADDFLWSIGSGYYLLVEHDRNIAALLTLSGEHKGKDHLDGGLVEDSAISNLYLGPQLLGTFNDRIAAEASLDFRVVDDSDDGAVIPDIRIRAGVSYRFS